MDTIHSKDLSDQDLLAETQRTAWDERCVTVRLIELLAEVDTRRLYLGESCPSLFVYCTRLLRLSESASYRRITAARLSRRFPAVLAEIAAGAINLTTVVLLAPHLTPENIDALLAAARDKSKNDVERLVAALAPQPDIPSSVKKLPAPRPRAEAEAVAATDSAAMTLTPAAQAQFSLRVLQRPVVAPLSVDRHLIRVTVSGDTRRKLERAQELLRHAVPTGDEAEILDRALTLLVDHLERTRLASVGRPRSGTTSAAGAHARTRYIPAAVKRGVWTRDEGRCAFVGSNGRCDATGFLEWHHVVPFAVGGSATLENLELRCRAHNAYEAALYFGDRGADPIHSRDG